MADPVALHSRVVFWLKIALPLAALAILSTLFLLARTPAPDASAAFPGTDLTDLAERPRLTRPEFSGVTRDGASLSVTADEAEPATQDTGGDTRARNIRAIYQRGGGFMLTVTSRTGTFRPSTDAMIFEGQAKVEASSGYRMFSERLTASMNTTRIESDVPVSVEGPSGRIDAGAMRLTGADGAGGHDVVVFTGGVRLVYDPQHLHTPSAP
jgi:lipopolysaccharide export system protein LptC